ncbi:MAG: hypothetical protein K0S30_1397 [Clostridia bacterium]|jgi:hypothetical protein|nr:hypothetical protein [Clostridia bacterium]
MQESRLSNKGYRYEVLLQAIDFFTQRFSLEQISHYAFEFTNEILTLHSSALFVYEEEQYVLKNSRLYDAEAYSIPLSQALEEIPVLHGDIIVDYMERFLSQETIETFNIKLVIPLIMDDFLYGFIISNGKTLSPFDEDDWIIARTLTKLFGSSFENSRQVTELNQKNKQLDQKIFNLFAINQSAKSLLSEVNLDRLYILATDIFSEITCSKVTSFGIYDTYSKSIKVLGYRNVSNYLSISTELRLCDTVYKGKQLVLHLERDLEIVKSIFENWQEFYLLETKYIVLLVKDTILGVVTLSEAVNERIYDESTFELVETLASFTHIAISNALMFKELVVQHERIKKKFNILDMLNKTIQNINAGVNIEEISRLTLKVLELNFGITKAFFAYKVPKGYKVNYTLGLKQQANTFILNDKWEKACYGEMILDFQQDTLHQFFDSDVAEELGSSNCVMIAPIFNAYSATEEETYPKGFLVVLETHSSLKEEEILLIDTITKNISPVIYQMDTNKKLQEEYIKDPLQQLIDAVAIKLEERRDYALDFYVYYKVVAMNPFEKREDFFVDGEACYQINNFIFILTYDELQDKTFCKCPDFETIEELTEFDFLLHYIPR